MTWEKILKNLPKDEKYDGGDPSERARENVKEDFRFIFADSRFSEIFANLGINSSGLMRAGQKFVNHLADMTNKFERFGKEGEREEMYRVEGDRRDESMLDDNEEYISNIISQILMSAYMMFETPKGRRTEEEEKKLEEEAKELTETDLNSEVSPFADAVSKEQAEDLYDEVENNLLEIFGDEADDQIVEFMEDPTTKNFLSYVSGMAAIARRRESAAFESADERPTPPPSVQMDERRDFSQEFKDMNKSWEYIIRK